jgi:hypothetical protein
MSQTKELRVGILSQNSVNTETLQSVSVKDINELKPDIYVECSQEDSTDNNDKRLINSIGNDYEFLYMESNQFFAYKKYGIKLKIYKKKTSTIKIEKKSISGGIIRLAKSRGSIINTTKGAAYVKLIIDGYKPLMFVSAHLPMEKTKDAVGNITDDLGNDWRKEAMLQLIANLKTSGYNDDTCLFFCGDLNFRITKKGIDQLTEFLKSNNDHDLKELTFNNKSKQRFTCKFNEDNEGCRETPVPQAIFEGTEDEKKKAVTNIESVQNECGDENRFPSVCDRILVSKSYAEQITVLLHEVQYLKIESDHNTLMAVVDIKPPSSPYRICGCDIKRGGKTKKKHYKKRQNNKKKLYHTKTQNNYKKQTTY